jgi:hypothetical protein
MICLRVVLHDPCFFNPLTHERVRSCSFQLLLRCGAAGRQREAGKGGRQWALGRSWVQAFCRCQAP